MASSLPRVVPGVEPELTAAATLVLPVAVAFWSTMVASATVDSPEYSLIATPMSAAEVARAVMVGRVPPPAVTGAVHTVISVWSAAVKRLRST